MPNEISEIVYMERNLINPLQTVKTNDFISIGYH